MVTNNEDAALLDKLEALAREKWNAEADEHNQWSELGQDERGALIQLVHRSTGDEGNSDRNSSSRSDGTAAAGESQECLQDVVSHHGDFHMACTVARDLHLRNGDRDSASYWDKQLHVLARMKVQAETALMNAQAATSGSDETQSVKVDERVLFDKAFLSWNGFHTKAELDAEWNACGGLAATMFREGFRAALDQQVGAHADYVLVPKKLSPEVVDAIAGTFYDLDDSARELVREEWACALAMISQHTPSPAPVTEEVRQMTAEQLEPLLADWFGLEECKGTFNQKRMLAFVRAAMSACATPVANSQVKAGEAK